LAIVVVDVRDALVGVGLILNDGGNFSFDKGLSVRGHMQALALCSLLYSLTRKL